MSRSDPQLKTLYDELNLLTGILKSYNEPRGQNVIRNQISQNRSASYPTNSSRFVGRHLQSTSHSFIAHSSQWPHPYSTTKSNNMRYCKTNPPPPQSTSKSLPKSSSRTVLKAEPKLNSPKRTVFLNTTITEKGERLNDSASKFTKSNVQNRSSQENSSMDKSLTNVNKMTFVNGTYSHFISKNLSKINTNKPSTDVGKGKLINGIMPSLNAKLLKSVSSPEKVNVGNTLMTPTKSIPSLSKHIVASKYRVINKNSPIQNLTKKLTHQYKNYKKVSTPQSMKKVIQTKYKIVNKKKSPRAVPLSKFKTSLPVKNTESSNSPTSSKHLIMENKPSNQNFNNMTPEELIALDNISLLKLSSMVGTTKKKKEDFIKKTDYKMFLKKDPAKIDFKSWKPNGTALLKNTALRTRTSNNLHQQMNAKSKTRELQQKYRKRANYIISKAKMTWSNPIAQKPKGNKVVSLRGTKFVLGSSGKSLRKLPVYGTKKIMNATNLESSPALKVKNIASRVLHRSIQTAVAAKTRKSQGNPYCMFYNRFGKCSRNDCPYIHDPSKIAVCTRFLRGTCKTKNCPFSHERNPGKMAICSFYLQGSCKTEDCPYRHEKIAPNAALCQDFVCGYCPFGKKCPKAHIQVCPDYFTGDCPKDTKCPYPHPPRKERSLFEKPDETPKPLTEQPVETPIENKKDDEQRYFKNKESVSSGDQDEVLEKGRSDCAWVGPGVPILPKYIPFIFEDTDCVMK